LQSKNARTLFLKLALNFSQYLSKDAPSRQLGFPAFSFESPAQYSEQYLPPPRFIREGFVSNSLPQMRQFLLMVFFFHSARHAKEQQFALPRLNCERGIENSFLQITQDRVTCFVWALLAHGFEQQSLFSRAFSDFLRVNVFPHILHVFNIPPPDHAGFLPPTKTRERYFA
jgi:hypothetical protein